MPNPYLSGSIWIGERYNDANNELRAALILMESTRGNPPATDPQWILYFINQEAVEKKDIEGSFSRLYKFMENKSGAWPQVYAQATPQDLQGLFNRFAFYNYVSPPIAPINSPVTGQHLRAAREPFRQALEIIKPTGVWIIGSRHAEHAKKVIGAYSQSLEYTVEYTEMNDIARASDEDCHTGWEKFRNLMCSINGCEE